jgi:class 3 adenylate cyclase
MSSLPLGTVTFLFTDIEGSTRLLQHLGDKFATVIAEHDQLLRNVWQKHRGSVVGTQGDSFFVAFPGAVDGIDAAVEAQRVLHAHDDRRARFVCGWLAHREPQIGASENCVGIDVHRRTLPACMGAGAISEPVIGQEEFRR